MKKKILVFSLILAMLVCIFAISVSAEGSESDAFGTAETVDGIPVDLNDTTSRVVLKGADGLYRTFPSAYIYFKTGAGNWGWRGEAKCSFDALNTALGLEGDNAYTIDSVIRIEVPDDIRYIEGYSGKTNLREMYFSPNSQMVNMRPMGAGCGIEKITMPPLQTSYASYLFHTCPNLVDVIFYENVNITSLPAEMFKACTSLKTVTIPEGVTSIGTGFFAGCTSLETVTLPSTLTSVGTNFRGLTSLKYVNTEYLTSFSNESFEGCTNLDGIVINSAVTIIPNDFCKDCTSLTSIVIPAGVTEIKGYAFSGCSKLASVTNYAEGIEVLNGGAFSGCPITEFNMPDSLTTIGNSCFAGAQFTEIDIPKTVTSIGEGAFQNCKNLSYILIPEGVTQIPHNFRAGGGAELTIVVPRGCTSIYSQYSLQNCNIVSIIFTGTEDSEFVASVQSKASSYVNLITYENHCKMYYNGVHAEDTNPCLIECTRCGLAEQDPNAVHAFTSVIVYENGVAFEGTITSTCSNTGCVHSETPLVEKANAILTCLGYSSNQNYTSMTLGYTFDKEAYDAYLANNGENVVSFGFVAYATGENASCTPLAHESGNISATEADRTIFASMDSHLSYASYDFVIRGFDATTAQESIAMCAYTYDGNEIKYLSKNTEGVFGAYDVAYATTFEKEIL